MKRVRPPITAALLLGAIALVAIASPASGVSTGKLTKQIKAQVAAIQKQQGPAGPAGVPGTARAYGSVDDGSCGAGSPQVCSATKAKGITSVTRDGANYCVKAAGIDPSTTSVSVSVDYDNTGTAENQAQMMVGGVATNCSDGFRVRAGRTDNADATNVAFTIVIP